MRTEWYFGSGFSSREEIEEQLEIWDGSRLSKVEYCPRQFYYDYECKLRPPVYPRWMKSGSAIHYGLDCFYSSDDVSEEDAVRLAGQHFDENVNTSVPDPKGQDYLTRPHIEIVTKYYFDQWLRNRIETYTPIRGLTLDDLNLDDVIAAKWEITPEGYVVFGESNLIMWLTTSSGERFAYAGKPDLPVHDQAGNLYIMDHKATVSYLSDWWAKRKFGSGNKMQGYMAMMASLLDRPFDGAIINGIYMGERAASDSFGGTRSHRYMEPYPESVVQESVDNQYEWIQLIHYHRERDAWPRGCDQCRHPKLCNTDLDTRPIVMSNEYETDTTLFFDI